MAHAGIPGRPDGPITALLQARAAVPSVGRVPGFGAIVSKRVAPPEHGVASVSPANLYQAQKLEFEATQPVSLSARTASPPNGAPSDPTPPAEDSVSGGQRTVTSATTKPLVSLGQPVPSILVPHAMMEALDKYEALKKEPQATTSIF